VLTITGEVRHTTHNIAILISFVLGEFLIFLVGRHLNLSNEALGWMMAIDVSFLLEFLQTFSKNNGALQRIPSRMSHLVDPSRRTSSHSMLLRDVVMLENQVPLFLLLKAIESRCPTAVAQPAAQSVLSSMLVGFFQEVSTFRGIGRPCTDANRHVHLLDFLYSNMVPRCAEESHGEAGDESCHGHDDHGKSTLNSVMDLLVSRGSKIVSVTVDFLLRVLLKFIASLPCLSVLGEPIEQLTQHAAEPSGGAPGVPDKNRSPLLEEIAVPSVAELAYTGVRFCPTVGDLSAVDFCPATATLHLPVIGVDVNSEVVLRNLVAYEAAAGLGPLVLARYVELMNGIIDTEEDARLLRECGVVLNHLKSDREVAELWNGMTRSVRLTRVPALDRVIDDLNRHYGGCWKVRVRTFVKARVLGSRELLACVAVVLLFLFVGLQAFCVLRGCVPVSYGMASRKFGAA